MYHG
ncbi:hypothetical protein LINGRAHAP2_LOCUS31682 [Linum grandiflorum]